MARLYQLFLDYLFPRSEPVRELFTISHEKLAALPRPEAIRDADVVALFEYRHSLVKRLVWEVKYKGNKELAARLGTLLFDTLVAELEERHVTDGEILLVPVPSSAEKRLSRGWNQAELLARAAARNDASGRLAYAPKLLEKKIETKSQIKSGSRKERLKNLERSMFVPREEKAAERTVVVIDDVTTTGATFAEAKRALLEAGAKRVLCIALAH